MHLWQIEHKRKVWLCNHCLRKLTDVVLLGSWEWIDKSNDQSICCERCKCNDYTAKKYGRFRCFFRYFTQFRIRPARAKAYRRAIF